MNSVVTWVAALIGVALLGAGVIGSFDNPIASTPENQPIFHVDVVHDIVHLATGALALFIAFGMRGETQARALIGFGVLYLVVLVGTLVDADLFGILQHPVNDGDHVLHAVLAVVPIVVGWLALSQRSGTVLAD